MRRALQLARRARGRTAPNPMVGAVVVRDGCAVGEGYHHRAGEPHAEVLALRAAGEAARGADLYVTLEPCCHHGRTPPCTEAVLAAGVRRVFAAMEDPFPRVSGGGVRQLREAGVEVEVGLLEADARRLNEAFLKAVATGLPFVTLKMATTLDGKIATRTGDSRWITGEVARRHVQQLRNWHDAVLVGAGTARADDPLLTARLRGARNPLRVVVSTNGRLPLDSQLGRTAADVPTLIAVAAAPDDVVAGWRSVGADVVSAPAADGRVDLEALLRALLARGVHSVLVEGGAGLAGSLLDARLVDRLVMFLSPKIVGGTDAPGPVGGQGVERMADALALQNVQWRRFGEDLAVIGDVYRDH